METLNATAAIALVNDYRAGNVRDRLDQVVYVHHEASLYLIDYLAQHHDQSFYSDDLLDELHRLTAVFDRLDDSNIDDYAIEINDVKVSITPA